MLIATWPAPHRGGLSLAICPSPPYVLAIIVRALKEHAMHTYRHFPSKTLTLNHYHLPHGADLSPSTLKKMRQSGRPLVFGRDHMRLHYSSLVNYNSSLFGNMVSTDLAGVEGPLTGSVIVCGGSCILGLEASATLPPDSFYTTETESRGVTVALIPHTYLSVLESVATLSSLRKLTGFSPAKAGESWSALETILSDVLKHYHLVVHVYTRKSNNAPYWKFDNLRDLSGSLGHRREALRFLRDHA